MYRILVVDDLKSNATLLKKILIKSGYEVQTCLTGKQALDEVLKANYDCILLDVLMPEMSGFMVIQRLKNNSKTKDIPVIFLSADDETKSKKEGFELGAVDYITKPFSTWEVLARVRTHVKLYQTLNSLINAQAETLKQIQNVQSSLNKKPEDYKNAHFSVIYESLHAAGGDIYEIIEIDENRIGYFVGDFAGHSLSTGFLTSSVKALLKQNCNKVNTPVESMTIINKVLCELMPVGHYLTACYAVLDKLSGELSVVNLGHPPLLYIPMFGSVQEVGNSGDILGAFEDALYTEVKIKVYPGDKFMIITDGLIEGQEVWFSAITKLKEIASSHSDLEREPFIEVISKETESLRKGDPDDVLVLVSTIPGEVSEIKETLATNALSIQFSSIKPIVEVVNKRIIAFVSENEVIEDVFGLELILFEVLNNAVIHGNKCVQKKWVKVDVSFDELELKVKVVDEGNGFDWKAVLEKVEAVGDNLDATSGRGFPLMKGYGYEPMLNEKGNELILVKSRNS